MRAVMVVGRRICRWMSETDRYAALKTLEIVRAFRI
jgi:hypothetical protein